MSRTWKAEYFTQAKPPHLLHSHSLLVNGTSGHRFGHEDVEGCQHRKLC